MRNPNFAIFLLINTLFIWPTLQAQNFNQQNLSTDSIVKLYKNQFHNDLNYVNGREYKPYHHPTNENPYLQSSSGIGSIYINGDEYKKRKLLYDIFKDLLVVNPEYYEFSNRYIQLNKSEIDSFTINFEKQTYTFINFKNTIDLPGLAPGFYERVYLSQHSTLLIKHSVRKGVDNAITTYSYTTQRFLLIGDNYYNVTTKKKLLALFPDDKKQLKKKIKSINLSYKHMSNNQLTQLLQFIDTL